VLLLSCLPWVQELQAILSSPEPDEHYSLVVSFVRLADFNYALVDSLLASPLQVLGILDSAVLEAQQEVYTCTRQPQMVLTLCRPTRRALWAQMLSLIVHGFLACIHLRLTHCPPPPHDIRRFPPSAAQEVKVRVHTRISGLPYHLDTGQDCACPAISAIRSVHVGKLITAVGTIARTGAVKAIESHRLYECNRCKGRWATEVLACLCGRVAAYIANLNPILETGHTKALGRLQLSQ
jgi:DNA replicative helicase MCM subunit Mcm2 (Cdc46/Mcm family)